MTIAVRQLLHGQPVDTTTIDTFLEAHRFPLIEGRTATFVFRGEADTVLLRHWIYGLQSTQELTRIDGTDVWYLPFELPEGSRVEYKFEVIRGDDHHLIRDPLNPQLAHDPYGANSVCHGEGYEVPEWIHPDEEARPGRIVRAKIPSRAFGEDREIGIYVPPRLRPTRRYPLLIVHDGEDYLRFASLQAILDNLIYRFEIPQLIVALTQSPARLGEYANDERHADFIAHEVLPYMESRFDLLPEPTARGLLGASFGAIASLSTAWRHPGVFGTLLLQSGSFAFTDIGDRRARGPVFEPVVDFVNQFRDAPGRPAERLFLTCGLYESLVYENRSLVPRLQATGMDVRYVESRDGHNWENWRDRLREGLTWLFPGPLWMVYE